MCSASKPSDIRCLSEVSQAYYYPLVTDHVQEFTQSLTRSSDGALALFVTNFSSPSDSSRLRSIRSHIVRRSSLSSSNTMKRCTTRPLNFWYESARTIRACCNERWRPITSRSELSGMVGSSRFRSRLRNVSVEHTLMSETSENERETDAVDGE